MKRKNKILVPAVPVAAKKKMFKKSLIDQLYFHLFSNVRHQKRISTQFIWGSGNLLSKKSEMVSTINQ